MGRVTLTLDELNGLLAEAVVRELGIPMMNLAGRRLSTNVIDKRGQAVPYLEMLLGFRDKLDTCDFYLYTLEGSDEARRMLAANRNVSALFRRVQAAYSTAKSAIGGVIGRIVNRAGMVSEDFGPGMPQMPQGNGQTITPKRLTQYMGKFLGDVCICFERMVKDYCAAVGSGTMNRRKAMGDINQAYKIADQCFRTALLPGR